MIRLLYSIMLTLIVTVGLALQDVYPAPAGAGISATWKLVENRSEGRFKCELTLDNNGTEDLSGDWALYFNSVSKLFADSVSAGCELTHVNGDFYVLRPATGAKPLEAGDSRTLTWEGGPWAINISDAPSGFYLIRNARIERPSEPLTVPLRIEPFPAAKLQRGASDMVPVVTAESRYAENESLTKMPADQLIKVVPTPAEIRPSSGHVWLQGSTKIFHEPAVSAEAKFLANALNELLVKKVSVEQVTAGQHAAPNSIRLRVGQLEVASAAKRKNDEAYALTVSQNDGIEITGSDPAGVFYGLQTLLALLPIESYRQRNDRIKIDAIQIADAPRFHYRGLHLDVARNFQTKRTVMQLLDVMAFYKLNRLHWHLTDDEGWRIEIKQLPELTMVGGRRGHTLDESDRLVPSYGSGPIPNPALSAGTGFYSQEDMIAILRYAQSRHIAVIPEFDFPGHARAAINAMEARHRRLVTKDPKAASEFLLREPNDESKYESVQLWRDNVVDVGRDAVYRFLDVVVGELADIYERAGVPLTSVHLGGDEVPNGAWEKSPACERIRIDANAKIPRRGQLELYFLNRASETLAGRSIQPACWEDCLLLEVAQNTLAGLSRREAGGPTPIAYVWNNVWGWGREDAAYRLANAGFDVVLCNATHLYFDLACEKDPLERGYYWAGFVGMRAAFEFVPLDVFKNVDRNAMGQPVNEVTFVSHVRLSSEGARHILGIQGELWAENLRDAKSLEYMAFPRVITLAERAWARSPEWADGEESIDRAKLDADWNQFANRLGQRELPRLDFLCGGVHYRLPPPGAVIRSDRMHANVPFPGLEIRYTVDGTDPDKTSPVYSSPVTTAREVKVSTFDTRGRSSRTVAVKQDHLPAK